MENNKKLDYFEEQEQILDKYNKAIEEGKQDEFVLRLLRQKLLEFQDAFNHLSFATSLLNNDVDVNDFLVNEECPYPFELSLDEEATEVDSWVDAVVEIIEFDPRYTEE